MNNIKPNKSTMAECNIAPIDFEQQYESLEQWQKNLVDGIDFSLTHDERDGLIMLLRNTEKPVRGWYDHKGYHVNVYEHGDVIMRFNEHVKEIEPEINQRSTLFSDVKEAIDYRYNVVSRYPEFCQQEMQQHSGNQTIEEPTLNDRHPFDLEIEWHLDMQAWCNDIRESFCTELPYLDFVIIENTCNSDFIDEGHMTQYDR